MSSFKATSTSLQITGAIVLATILTAAPASSDWLVFRDGSRVETDGTWEQRGKMVVFTDASGRLMSVRLSDVDLDKSAQVTHEAEIAASQPPPAPPPPQPSVFSLTDADVSHIDDETFLAAEGAAGEEGESSEEPAVADVAVTDWNVDDSPDGEGQIVRGTVVNRGTAAVLSLTAQVTVFDSAGVEIGASGATLGSTSLVPSESTNLVASFPDLFDISAVRFNVRHQSFDIPAGPGGLEEGLGEVGDDEAEGR